MPISSPVRGVAEKGGLIELVEIREGDALKTVTTDLPDTLDLVLLDGAKALYPDILALLEPAFAQLLLWSPTMPTIARNISNTSAPRRTDISTPFAEDIELSMRSA